MKIRLMLLVVFVFFIAGCSQKFTYVEKKVIISSLDFSKYKNSGFLITPGEFGGNYEAIGIFSFHILPEANYLVTKTIDKEGKETSSGKWVAEKINASEILDTAYKTALEKGANGITHFKLDNFTEHLNDGVNSFTLDGLKIEGLLIIRK